MSFWTDLLVLGPTLLWKMDEASGTQATDASPNGKHGTYTNAPTLAQASIIPGEPASTSVGYDGVNDHITIADSVGGLDPGDTFTAVLTYMPRSFAAQRDIVGKTDCWQLWQETSGKLQAHITPAWTSFLSASALTLNTAYFVVLRKWGGTTDKASIWINGVKDAEVNHLSNLTNTAGPVRFAVSSTANRYVNCRGQGFAYFVGTALTDQQIADLYQVWLNAPPNDPPTQPGAFTVPVAGQILDRATVNVAWGVSTDPQGDDFKYELEISSNAGANWSALFTSALAPAPPATYALDPALMAEGSQYKLRVRGVDEFADASAWTESPLFEIAHDPTPPAAPTIEVVHHAYVMYDIKTSAFSSPVPGATHKNTDWEFYDEGDAVPFDQDLADAGLTYKEAFKPTRPIDSPQFVRCRHRDNGDFVSAWSRFAFVRTSREYTPSGVAAYTGLLAHDVSGHGRHGVYGHYEDPGGGSVFDHSEGGPKPYFPLAKRFGTLADGDSADRALVNITGQEAGNAGNAVILFQPFTHTTTFGLCTPFHIRLVLRPFFIGVSSRMELWGVGSPNPIGFLVIEPVTKQVRLMWTSSSCNNLDGTDSAGLSTLTLVDETKAVVDLVHFLTGDVDPLIGCAVEGDVRWRSAVWMDDDYVSLGAACGVPAAPEKLLIGAVTSHNMKLLRGSTNYQHLGGGYASFRGELSEFACWWGPRTTHYVRDASDCVLGGHSWPGGVDMATPDSVSDPSPVILPLTAQPGEILAAAPDIYWRLSDRPPPAVPVLSLG